MNRPDSQSPKPEPELGWPTLRRLLGRFAHHKARTTAVFLVALVRSLAEAAYPLLIAAALDQLLGREGSGAVLPRAYWLVLAGLAASLLLRSSLFYVSQVQGASLGQDLENELRTDLFHRVMALRFRYHDENRSGKTIARSLRDMEKARHFFREVWLGWLEVGLILLAVVPMIWWVHWSYGLIVTVTFGIGIAACVHVGKGIAKRDREISDVYDDVTTTLQENVAGARVVRAFGREPQEVRKFGGHMDRFSGSWASLERFWTSWMPGINHLYVTVLPAILVIATLRIANGEGGIGEVTAALLYVRMVHHRIRPLTRLVILGQQATASASRVFEVLDREELIEAPDSLQHLPPEGGDLRLEDVHFGHGEDVPVLRGVTLHVPAGSSLGILGPTGSGKSSLVQLLPRFYDPSSGVIRLDGIDIQDLDIVELRRAVGLVFQESLLFSGTVADNIAYGNPGIDRDTVVRCATLAAAHEFIETLTEGYETIVGERGVSLSGGQQQRLTIARALAMDPRILIFDDATASVDAVTEKILFEGIRAAARGRTTLVISQRVTSVRWCDRIAVLEEGRIANIGTHAELLHSNELYREIHQHQMLERAVS